MKKRIEVPAQISRFLGSETPDGWARAAATDLPLLLNDHANCEKKAAATALSLMFRYAADDVLSARMSRLAREELRHYEQVARIMRQRGIAHRALPASRYARTLMEAVRGSEPGRRSDTLIVGALIEARSCERFARLIPYLDDELGRFYGGLLASEARHFEHYLALARASGDPDIDARLTLLRKLEAGLAVEPDTELRFHSGPPTAPPRAVSPDAVSA